MLTHASLFKAGFRVTSGDMCSHASTTPFILTFFTPIPKSTAVIFLFNIICLSTFRTFLLAFTVTTHSNHFIPIYLSPLFHILTYIIFCIIHLVNFIHLIENPGCTFCGFIPCLWRCSGHTRMRFPCDQTQPHKSLYSCFGGPPICIILSPC